MNTQAQDQQPNQKDQAPGVVTQWTFRAPPLGEHEEEWLYSSHNPECPIAFLTLKKTVVPQRPAEVIVTLTVIPRDQPAGGTMPIASLEHAETHVLEVREVQGAQVPRGREADGAAHVRIDPAPEDVPQ